MQKNRSHTITKTSIKKTRLPHHTESTEWLNTTVLPPTTTTENIWSTPWHRNGLHWIIPMAISMFKCTYRSELQGIPSKLELHAIPKQDRNTVLYSEQEQTIIRNHLEIRLILLAVTFNDEWQNDIYDSSFLELLPPRRE